MTGAPFSNTWVFAGVSVSVGRSLWSVTRRLAVPLTKPPAATVINSGSSFSGLESLTVFMVNVAVDWFAPMKITGKTKRSSIEAVNVTAKGAAVTQFR